MVEEMVSHQNFAMHFGKSVFTFCNVAKLRYYKFESQTFKKQKKNFYRLFDVEGE